MKKLIKPASLLFYLLIIIIFFFVGIFIAKFVGAGKNQMLAAGTIVIFYGMVSAGIAFISALFIVYIMKHSTLVKINKLLGVLFFLLMCFTTYKFITHEKKEVPVKNQAKKTTTPIDKKHLIE